MNSRTKEIADLQIRLKDRDSKVVVLEKLAKQKSILEEQVSSLTAENTAIKRDLAAASDSRKAFAEDKESMRYKIDELQAMVNSLESEGLKNEQLSQKFVYVS